jgi:glycosyltransferase involved in cell wall biosynthesis
MIYFVVNDFRLGESGFVNGGSKHTFNILKALKQINVNYTIITLNFRPHTETLITKQETQLGSIIEINHNISINQWKQPEIVNLIKSLLIELPPTPSIFHLRDLGSDFGSWIEALQDTKHKIIFHSVDYAWLCARSHLLTFEGKQCTGPQSVNSCLNCFYSHREIKKTLILKGLLASSYFPNFIQQLLPNKLKIIINSAISKRRITEERITDLNKDFDRVDALIVHSQILGKYFQENQFPLDKIFHVPTGIEKGKKISFSERPNLQNSIVFGFAGKLTYDKGLDILINALFNLRAKTSKQILLIVYSRPHESGFGQEILKVVKSQEWIILDQYDGKNSESIDKAHQKIHFLVTCSRWTDNLPNTVLEAICRHTLVIAPDQGCFPEMITNSVNGLLYEPQDNGLEKLLTQIITEPEKYMRLSFESGHLRTPLREAQDIIKIYDKLQNN